MRPRLIGATKLVVKVVGTEVEMHLDRPVAHLLLEVDAVVTEAIVHVVTPDAMLLRHEVDPALLLAEGAPRQSVGAVDLLLLALMTEKLLRLVALLDTEMSPNPLLPMVLGGMTDPSARVIREAAHAIDCFYTE